MSHALTAMVEGYLDLRWRMDPVAATRAGRHELDDIFADWSKDGVRTSTAAMRSYDASLEEVALDDLEDEIDRTAALHAVRHDLLRMERERPFARNPAHHLAHATWGMALLILRNSQDPPRRAASLLARLRALPDFLTRAREALTDPVTVFIETARAMLPGTLALVRVGIDSPAIDLRSLDPQELQQARDAAATALLAFNDRLTEMAEHARDDFAIGRDLFDRTLHTAHMIRENADELARYGERLREEASLALETAAHDLRPGVHWRDLVRELRAELMPEHAMLVAFAQAIAATGALTRRERLALVPSGDCVVMPAPAFLRPFLPAHAYIGPGAYEVDQSGIVLVAATHAFARAELAGLAASATIPGRHLHRLSSNRSARPARRLLGTPAAVSGWAAYSETLVAEHGLLASPAERLFGAWHLLWHALRIGLDVGLHTRRLARASAERVLVDELGLDDDVARGEVARLCAMPTLGSGAAIGRREILELRDDAREARGASFDLGRFHDDLMRFGGLPVALARWGMAL